MLTKKVQTKYYNLLKSGIKTIELRLWDEKRQLLKMGDEITFSDISVVHDDNGHPEIMITGGARAALKTLAGQTATVHLSITDQDNFSAAIVVIEK